MKIGVVGLGLIGGSIFKRLKELDIHEVIGVSRTLSGVANVTDDYNLLKNCDLVFICTPMNTVLNILDNLNKILHQSTIVTDVSSLKGFVSKKKYKFNFIPSHPMAGTEKSGWENSFPELFDGAKWVITPLNGLIDDSFETLEKIIESLGAKVIITTSNKLAQAMASSGFRDTTRLALSNTEMADDMVDLNKDNIKKSIEEFSISLDELLSGDYKTQIKKIREFRANLYP